MKKILLPCFLLVFAASAVQMVQAQDPQADPGTYMSSISVPLNGMNKAYMAYLSASAHSSRKRKVEKLRDKAVEAITNCQSAINYLPAYKGDNSLRQSSLDFVGLCYKIFNEDYAHIVNMEDISEQSYDEMQAYLLLEEATDDTLKVGNERIAKAQKNFAAKYNITLTDDKSELGEKLEITGNLSKYRNKVFLTFFKCNWEDNQLTEAVNQKNVTKIEQTRSALLKYAVDGTKVLDTLHAFDNDSALADACKQALAFYKTEAETQVPQITDYFLKEEAFNKLKATMDAKPKDQLTQQDVDAFNKAVADINAAVSNYNQTNNDLNNGRTANNKNYNDTERAFTDAHTPYYK